MNRARELLRVMDELARVANGRVRLALVRLALVRLAPVRLTPVRLTLVRLTAAKGLLRLTTGACD